MPEIMMERQGKRRHGKIKTRRRLKGNIIKMRTLEAILLDDKILKVEYHEEEEIKYL
jgi:hypothetical protein